MNMRRIFLLIGLVGIGVILTMNFGGFGQFLKTLKQLHWYVIPLVIVIQIGSYIANAKFYDTFFKLSGHIVSMKRLIQASLAINFVNQAIPAGGIAGTTYLSRSLAPEVPPGKSTLAQLSRYVFSFLSFLPLLGLGFIITFFSGNIGRVSVRLILFVIIVTITLGAGAIGFFSERSRMRKIVSPLVRFYNRVGKFFFRKSFKPLTAVEVGEFFDEFYSGYRTIMRKKNNWIKLLGWAMAGNFAEMATVYVTFIGFGIWVNVGVVIIAYLIAIAASLLGPLTAGAGALEFGMVGGFTALGIPFTLSFAVVVVYRFLNMLLFLPPGFYFYRKDLTK
jgi:uncharacterized protein (TIRG00374 family)